MMRAKNNRYTQNSDGLGEQFEGVIVKLILLRFGLHFPNIVFVTSVYPQLLNNGVVHLVYPPASVLWVVVAKHFFDFP